MFSALAILSRIAIFPEQKKMCSIGKISLSEQKKQSKSLDRLANGERFTFNGTSEPLRPRPRPESGSAQINNNNKSICLEEKSKEKEICLSCSC